MRTRIWLTFDFMNLERWLTDQFACYLILKNHKLDFLYIFPCNKRIFFFNLIFWNLSKKFSDARCQTLLPRDNEVSNIGMTDCCIWSAHLMISEYFSNKLCYGCYVNKIKKGKKIVRRSRFWFLLVQPLWEILCVDYTRESLLTYRGFIYKKQHENDRFLRT